ncbi:peptidase A2 domain-containing protein [Nephila pilipes]|uniref:Peptidase A2 domain-containing protein n=1 Tax=Nephila pilipes TaxID=299642 RepID=A0A8X6MX86_NEPPI|nr:peptidase A2 domain-containing protein [Nephila pilipes]
MSYEDSAAAINIARVLVKILPFWRGNSEIWFTQMGSQFILAGIAMEITKFHHVISVLQPEESDIVGDIILSSPAEKQTLPIKG